MGDGELEAVLAACTAREERDLADLCRLIVQPSTSAQNVGVRECADLFLEILTGAELTARLMPTAAQPIINAECCRTPGTRILSQKRVVVKQTERPIIRLGIREGVLDRCLHAHPHVCYGYSNDRDRSAVKHFVAAGGTCSVE